MYVLADLIEAAREGQVTLKYPEAFPIDFSDFQDKSIDVRNLDGENGLAFNDIFDFLMLNEESIKIIRGDDAEYEIGVIKKLNARDDQYEGDDYFLETFRSLRGKRECVYGVLKNT